MNQKCDVPWLLLFHTHLLPVGFSSGSLMSFVQNNCFLWAFVMEHSPLSFNMYTLETIAACFFCEVAVALRHFWEIWA